MERSYEINKRLKMFIAKNDKRPSAIADKAGISRPTFSRITHSRRPIYADELFRICAAAGIPLDELTGETEAG